MNILVVVDMQNDFIDGSLGTEEAQRIVPEVVKKIQTFDGIVFATRDTHEENYLETAEGKKLPVRHCIRGTEGWQIRQEISDLLTEAPVDKVTIGLCTDICVISNAMLCKAFLPEVPVQVDASCCAGVTVESHMQALEAMKMCQIDIL